MAYQGLAFAKVNLTLDIVGVRPDGYHLLESVMQSLSLCDVVEARPAAETTLTCDMPGLACDESNLALRAWRLMQQEFSLDGGMDIVLHKEIPLGGGLGGGSADAAQVLLAVNELYALGLSYQRLIELAARLGADVPFCLYGGTALAEGIGEKLTPLGGCPELRLVLVNPGIAVATPQVYRQYDAMGITPAQGGSPHTEAMRQALASGSPSAVGGALYNALEQPAFAVCPELAAIKAELADMGLAALLCGSGATVMGIARDKKQAAVAEARLTGKYPFVCAVKAGGF